MERCPCCNARLNGATLCPRCRSELGKTLAAEQAAKLWLAEAIRLWQKNQAERSLTALERSLQLKSGRLALALRDFFTDRLCQDILELLAQKQVLEAKQRLYRIRHLLPGCELLHQLNAYADYLLVRD